MSKQKSIFSEPSSESDSADSAIAFKIHTKPQPIISDEEPMSEDEHHEAHNEPHHEAHNKPHHSKADHNKDRRKHKHELKEYLNGKPAFSVNKVRTFLRDNNYANRITHKAAAALTGTIQRLLIELMIEAGRQTRKAKRKRITPRHLCLAIQKDEEFSKLLGHVTIPEGGVVGIVGPRSNPNAREERQEEEEDDFS